MWRILKPRQMTATIYDINLQPLWDSGYQYMIIDVDNTITAWNNYQVSDELMNWIKDVKKIGFRICLLSNNQQNKIQEFASELGVIAAPKGGKPFSRAFQSALTALGAAANNTLVIGDQLFTDILGGNRAGLYSILVEPIDRNEFIGTRVVRFFEGLFTGRRFIWNSHRQQR